MGPVTAHPLTHSWKIAASAELEMLSSDCGQNRMKKGECLVGERPHKERADIILVRRGLAPSQQKAQALIMAGLIVCGGQKIAKPGQLIETNQELTCVERIPYVSRGGLKLAGALDAFKISVKGKIAADLGTSTGGFTDCLLQRGVKKVYAVDVDTRQMNCHLRQDSRVIPIEKNARYLTRDDFEEQLNIVTLDLSFISVLKVLPALADFLGRGKLLALIKPQFEVGRGQVGKKGIVRDPALHGEVLAKVIGEASNLGFKLRGLTRSSIRGQKGNREFFVYWALSQDSLSESEVENMIKREVWDEKN
jgi:23S rRNA (cytidine1920-2'-O)/16S rRNA (cytidine1409-2'-O)-methyltransferase